MNEPRLRTAPRVLAAATMALVLTAGLVLLMHHLIEQDEPPPEAADPPKLPVFWAQIEEPPLPPREPPQPPDEPEQPPEVEFQWPEASGGEPLLDAPLGPPKAGPPRLVASGLPDGEMLPVVRVAPNYPNRARSRGLEGYVLVEFTVDELGRVVDPVVIDAHPNGVFDRAALEAVQRYKYRPRVVNGAATRVTGVRHRISFELTSA